MKRFLSLVLISATLLYSTFLLSGCDKRYYKLVYEDLFYGNYYYDDFIDKKCVHIGALTEQAKQLKTIIVPAYINGCPVRDVGSSGFFGGYTFHSDTAERVYLPATVISARMQISPTGKIIYMSSERQQDLNSFCNPYFEMLSDLNKIQADTFAYSYANVVYLYNYENAPDSGIYLLDDYDNEPILYPPEISPTREGYRFAGWYKEKECLTPWDFATNIIPEKHIYSEEFQENNQIYYDIKQHLTMTQLFAKWEKN